MTPALFVLLLLAQAGAEWPGFRGPAGDGVAAKDADPPVEWSETKNVVWKTAIPALGRSSPVVMGDRIFLTGARERAQQKKKIGPDEMQVAEHISIGALCLDRASGRILWDVVLREVDNPEPVHILNSWATPTPAVEPGRLYCEFGGFGTWCLDPETGKVLWEKRIPMDAQVGPGSSPVIYKDLVLLIRDGREAQYVAALDKKSGEIAWKTERPPVQTSSPNSRKSFSTPLLIRGAGRDQFVGMGPHWLVSYDPATGKELWRLKHGDGYSIGSVPILAEDVIYAGTGCSRPAMLSVRPDGEGDVTSTHLIWRVTKSVPMISSPVYAAGHLYWNSDQGLATCADAKTGNTVWQTRLGEGHLASPLFAGGRVYFFGKEGMTTVAGTGTSFEKISENKLDGVLIATPAAVGKALYFRTDANLYRLENH